MTNEQLTHRLNGNELPDVPVVRAVRNSLLPVPVSHCTAQHLTFGGRCMNCGGVNGHAPQPRAVRA